MKTDIRGVDANELNPWKVMALRDHLGPDHDVDVFVLESAEHGLGMSTLRGHVAIESHDPRARKERDDFLFEALGAHAE